MRKRHASIADDMRLTHVVSAVALSSSPQALPVSSSDHIVSSSARRQHGVVSTALSSLPALIVPLPSSEAGSSIVDHPTPFTPVPIPPRSPARLSRAWAHDNPCTPRPWSSLVMFWLWPEVKKPRLFGETSRLARPAPPPRRSSAARAASRGCRNALRMIMSVTDPLEFRARSWYSASFALSPCPIRLRNSVSIITDVAADSHPRILDFLGEVSNVFSLRIHRYVHHVNGADTERPRLRPECPFSADVIFLPTARVACPHFVTVVPYNPTLRKSADTAL
ncbi:hypothetical protein B0H17DRAFT_1209672 [Mycena rosella]|uniref:Uncharacterized protein n=1 Tax=Mycena rosella TaxID=1033263 RepID=A0AAD7G9Q6_MYCRO|nr:hypothetical protein B0H17DRAFT_1209672 [Mycena rosella]